MNNLVDKLLQGQKVEWKTLGEVVSIKTGQSINKNFINENIGKYPVINSGREPLGYVNKWNTDNDPIGITTRGAGVGSILWQEGKYFRGNLNYSVTVIKSSEILNRFLYYVLINNQNEIHKLCTFSGIPALNSSELKKLIIPIPPLSVQNEIVKILDKTTALTTALTTELTLRKKQYEYYRDFLLSEQELAKTGFEWKTLGEVGNLVIGNGLQKKELINSGFPAIHYGQIYTKYNLFAENTLSFVCNEKVQKLKIALKNDLLLATTSENDTDLIKPLAWLGEKVAVSSEMMIFKHNQNVKFLVYFFQTSFFQKQKSKYITGTKVCRISKNDLLKFKIPVPPLAEQNRIVAILDQFDALTQSISEGLPCEIALRQKQYEYYREQLLDFGAK